MEKAKLSTEGRMASKTAMTGDDRTTGKMIKGTARQTR